MLTQARRNGLSCDLDAPDDPLHGNQEGRFYHSYYGGYCYLPLYITCGRHLLAAKLRPANIDGAAGAVEEVERIVARIRARWGEIKILLRADPGFARDEIMAWCEANGVDYLFGLAENSRLKALIAREAVMAKAEHERTGEPARRFADFTVRIRRGPRTAAKISSMRRTASMAIGARMALARSASSKNLAPPWAQHKASVSGAGAHPFA